MALAKTTAILNNDKTNITFINKVRINLLKDFQTNNTTQLHFVTLNKKGKVTGC